MAPPPAPQEAAPEAPLLEAAPQKSKTQRLELQERERTRLARACEARAQQGARGKSLPE